MRSAARSVIRPVSRAAAHCRDRRGTRPPWETTLLDDIADRRPWNSVVRAARAIAMRRRRQGPPAVVIVSWNTRVFVADVLDALIRYSPPDTPILVIDNGSTDGTIEMLRSRPRIRAVRLPTNAGHGVALDLAMCLVRSPVAVVLDSDAFPYRHGWLNVVVDPIRERAVVVAGTRSSRDYVHPMFLAVDVEEFLSRRLSFQVHREPGIAVGAETWGVNGWDTGELLCARLNSPELHFVERTPNVIDGLPGMTAGGVVYHHGGLSRRGRGPEEHAGDWRYAFRGLTGLGP